jgi:catechol 2,3-dioxygenase-like lactoylglutathione lyase family enzyme
LHIINEDKSMKRFHVNVSVADLARSRQFYTGLFGEVPVVSKDDYAKWMLEDPRLNFSITQSDRKRGIQHVGLQADTMEELADIQQRLSNAGVATVDQPDTECCYARSSKTWAHDPDDVAWETFVTHEQLANFGCGTPSDAPKQAERRCCA